MDTKFIFLLTCFIVYTTADDNTPEPLHHINQEEGSHFVDSNYLPEETHQEHAESNSNGYAASAGLTSLAQQSAIQANSAVQSQHVAAKQAAFDVKNNLAQAASGAASTAQAAVVGKQIIVRHLRQELHEAQQLFHGEIQYYQQSQQAASSAQKAAHQAQQQVNNLAITYNGAQQAFIQAAKVANQAAVNSATQSSMVRAAKVRIANLIQQLNAAVVDLQQTQVAGQKALNAAKIAQANANAVAESAAHTSSEAHEQLPEDHHSEYQHYQQ